MADLTDIAAALQAEHIALGLARVDPAIPAGVAGECDECGEVMPRLVGGRCGYCRDGRLHPFERGRPERPRACHPAPVKENTMPNPPGTKTVGFVARGEILATIEARVAATGTTTSAVVQSLVEAGLHKPGEPVIAAPAPLLDLAVVPLPDLLDELRHRVDRTAETTALLNRLALVETKLAAIAGVMAS